MKSADDIQNERRELLYKYLTEIMPAVPGQKVTVLDDPWRVKIEISAALEAAIIIEPSQELLTDMDNDFKNIIELGIKEAHTILFHPPEKHRTLQGTLRLDNNYKKEFVNFDNPE